MALHDDKGVDDLMSAVCATWMIVDSTLSSAIAASGRGIENYPSIDFPLRIQSNRQCLGTSFHSGSKEKRDMIICIVFRLEVSLNQSN